MTDLNRPNDRDRFRTWPSAGWLSTCGPGLIWLALFFFIPLFLIGGISFLNRGPYGEIEWSFTLGNYSRILGFGPQGFDPTYPKVLLRSLGMAAGTTALCILFALPLCF